MNRKFEWPMPPYYAVVDDAPSPFHEPAVAVLREDLKLEGTLTRMLPEHHWIDFLPARAKANVELHFDVLSEFRLIRPLKLVRRRAPVGEAPAGQCPAPQRFRIELHKGGPIEGETLGFLEQPYGIFLFIVVAENTIVRSFIPRSAIKAQQIGPPIGAVLQAQGAVRAEQLESALERQQALREKKIGDFLSEADIISPEQLSAALARQRSAPLIQVGQVLLGMNAITQEQLDEALERQKADRSKPLGEILVEMGYLVVSELKRALSQKLGIPFVDLSKFPVDPEALAIMPESVARELTVVPLALDGKRLVVAMENPLDGRALSRLRFISDSGIVPVMAGHDELVQAVRTYFGEVRKEGGIEELAQQLDTESESIAVETKTVSESDSTLVRLVNKMILDAHGIGASDIHVECSSGKKQVLIRFRNDGVLYDYLRLPAAFGAALVSRLKIMANLDISEHRHGQDGRIAFQELGQERLELRVAVIPTSKGLEDIVLRLLKGGKALPLAELGMETSVVESLKKLSQKSFGLLLVCGPTGSGKTTTLHSLMAHINTPERKIWTAEDPIEISQERLRQVQVNHKIGWTFAAAMRSFLRADPDVIMVGEMRDEETARMAIEASLTGHLVLSTLHTNSAPECVSRLLQIGMDRFNFGDALAGVLAQRLPRRLCPNCGTRAPLDDSVIDEFAAEYCYDTPFEPSAVIAAWREAYGPVLVAGKANGCKACRDTGYRGRTGLHELLIGSPEIRALIHRGATAVEIRAAAMLSGMRSLKQDGIVKCFMGLTDLQEVRAACS